MYIPDPNGPFFPLPPWTLVFRSIDGASTYVCRFVLPNRGKIGASGVH